MISNTQSELHGLQKLFATFESAANDPKRILFHPLVLREYLIAEVEQIQHRLLEKLTTIKEKAAVHEYARVNQYALVGIMNKLFPQIDQPAALAFHEELENLLTFVKKYFREYLDHNGMAPLKDIHAARVEIAESLPYLESELLRLCVFPQLVHIMLYPLKSFCAAEEDDTITFGRVGHLTDILKHAKEMCDDDWTEDNADERAICFLISLNYNSKKTFIQLTQFFQESLASHRYFAEVDYPYLLVVAMQSTVKPGTGFYPDAPTLKRQLTDYIITEITNGANLEDAEVESEDLATVKIELNMSPAELSCLLRRCTETGLIPADKISEVVDFLSNYCQTKGGEVISADSLRKNSYNIQAETEQAVQELLKRMLRIINKDFPD